MIFDHSKTNTESPGLVVMGGDSCFKGHGFETRLCILDGHFIKYICWKNFNDKRGRGWSIFNVKKI